jgi:hypothetical protein
MEKYIHCRVYIPFYKYRQYKWSNISAMLRNQKLDPEVCPHDFNNRLVVITGATSGIGYAAAEKYASHGAEILSIKQKFWIGWTISEN